MDLEMQTIRQCFFLFIKTLDINKINIPNSDKIEKMSISEIRASLDVIYMEYIVTSICSIQDNGLVTRAYKHLDKLIRKYCKKTNKNEVNSLKDKIKLYQDSVFPSFDENEENQNDIKDDSSEKDIKRQWTLF